MKRLACALVLAGSACAFAAVPRNGWAAPARAAGELQLNIITPDPSSIGDRLSLDVSFRGSPVDTVELYLDNALVAKRQIGTAQARGIITFTLETMYLTEGPHNVVVKAYSSDGKTASSSSRIRIPAADLSLPVRIAYPQNGIQVSGIVPVRVSIDSDIQKQKPYVTFFVDKEFRVLRNYPPYEYNWDTTKSPNGWHVLEAWTQTPDALSPLKTRPIHVNVNNAGGETRKQDKIEDLRDPAATKPIDLGPQATTVKSPTAPRAKIDPATARQGSGPVAPHMVGGASGLRIASRPASAGARSAEPSFKGYGVTSGSAALPKMSAPSARVNGPRPRMMGGAVNEPARRMAIASLPKDPNTLPGLSRPDPLFPVVPPTTSGPDTIKTQPGETLDKVSRRTGVPRMEIARLNNLSPSARLKGGSSLIVPRAGYFEVSFNGTPIVFDVAPRVENGIRLAPFRQIFEYTGGRLDWFNEKKTVRAVNDTREILLKIGKSEAMVNNHPLLMERAPFIDTGRTIVPLSFVRDSLNVKVHFDETSGRILIDSGK